MYGCCRRDLRLPSCGWQIEGTNPEEYLNDYDLVIGQPEGDRFNGNQMSDSSEWATTRNLLYQGIGYLSVLPGRPYDPQSVSEEGFKGHFVILMSCCVEVSCLQCTIDPDHDECDLERCCCMGDSWDMSQKAECNDE